MRILKFQIKNKTSHSYSISFILLVKIFVHSREKSEIKYNTNKHPLKDRPRILLSFRRATFV